MELYSLYYTVFSVIDAVSVGKNKVGAPMPKTMYISLIVAGVIWATLFILQGFALYTMAKKRGIQGKWRAFVPFADLYLMGKIAGECNVFGQKVKRAGMYAFIAQIILVILCATEIIGQAYLWTTQGAPSFDQYEQPYWSEAQGAAASLNVYLYSYNGFIISIIQMVYEIMMFIVLMGIYKRFAHNKHFLFSMLSLFIPLSRCIILFVIRNREEVDYDELMRQRREEFIRRRTGAYTETPQYTAYGTPMSPTPYKPEEPFAEFENEKKDEQDNDEFFS